MFISPRLLLLVTALVATVASYGCPASHWVEFESHCYWASGFQMNFTDAEHACWVARGKLASVHDLTTNSFLASRVASGRPAWVGLRKYENWSNATWSDHTPTDYWYWDPDHNTDITEWGIFVNFNNLTGQWSNAPLSTPMYFICQTDY